MGTGGTITDPRNSRRGPSSGGPIRRVQENWGLQSQGVGPVTDLWLSEPGRTRSLDLSPSPSFWVTLYVPTRNFKMIPRDHFICLPDQPWSEEGQNKNIVNHAVLLTKSLLFDLLTVPHKNQLRYSNHPLSAVLLSEVSVTRSPNILNRKFQK